MNGTDVLLYVNTGTNLSPVWEAAGSQRDASFDETTDEIDMSSKDSRAKRVIAGRYSAAVSLEALYVPSDGAYQALKDAMRNGDLILIRRQEQGVDTEEATALVTSLSEAAPDQEAVTVSISLTIDGEWTELGT